MKYVEAPDQAVDDMNLEEPLVFMAGGITDCPDWQQEMVQMFRAKGTSVVLMNPRRANFPIKDPTAAETQIRWEHLHLKKAHAIMFWFPKETLCPIVLYELGAWSRMGWKPIFVGMDPQYKRRQDVEIQTKLARPNVQIHYSLKDLATAVLAWDYKAAYTKADKATTPVNPSAAMYKAADAGAE